MRFITGGLTVIFLILLLYLILRGYLDSRRELRSPGEVKGETLPDDLREAALRPLRALGTYYDKRDAELADACIDDTMLPDELVILGTNPREIFHGRDGARQLLTSDWKYWGQVTYFTDDTSLFREGDSIYFVLRGKINLNILHFLIPLKMTDVLKEKDGIWRISKIQFANELESSYLIIAWIPSAALVISLLLFAVSCALHI